MATLTHRQLGSFPWAQFGRCVTVDLLRLYARCTEAVRLRLAAAADDALVLEWARRAGCSLVVDSDGYVAVAADESLARRVLRVDASSEPHELELGALLGYPRCCAAEIAQVGERAIDARARETHAWRFTRQWAAINPAHYLVGRALISHLPCSERCQPSLNVASRSLRALDDLAGIPAYADMRLWAAGVPRPDV